MNYNLIVMFRTNLVNYRYDMFPKNLTVVPRKGEFVMVNEEFRSFFRDKKLPTRLEVVSVTYEEDNTATCELWYNKTDLELSKMAGVNPFV